MYANPDNNEPDGIADFDVVCENESVLVALPPYVSVTSRLQNVHVFGAGESQIDDPREPPSTNVATIDGGRFAYNGGPTDRYVEMFEIEFTQPPPALVRMGIMADGNTGDEPVAIEVQQVEGGTARGTSLGSETPTVFIQFFDIRNAAVGDRFVVSMSSDAPNSVSYMGITFD